jgi:Na+-driven multidrug efflux pump
MRWRGWHFVFMVIAALAVVLLLSTPADAQCSMCRAALNGANNARFVRNLNLGILVLLIPPVTIFCSLFIVLRRNRGDG